jgi:hypothetical protein
MTTSRAHSPTTMDNPFPALHSQASTPHGGGVRSTPIVLLALAGACASGGSPGGPSTTQSVTITGASGGTSAISITQEAQVHNQSVPAPITKVWSLLPGVFDSIGILPTSIDPATHTISNTAFKVHGRLKGVPLSRYIDCGNSTQIGPSADVYDVVMSIGAVAKPDDARNTDVALVFEAVGRPATFSQDYSRCSTTGALEKRFSEILLRQVLR